ncbi:hypothetical protein [Ralstonia mannitolilytica]|uniref:hypothetical protein n=1 Tax=Ralstonia mannitolilytica TaxID=105219 RepID=UPI0028F61B83|nr:hypothetical protein [Ralstonia mannitolilytica]CAJ0858301.1 hypothetical protein R76727_01244 [Ralstonia mannitolilytica]
MLLNPYRLLLGLLPDPALQVGKVVTISNGVAAIEMPGGGLAQARGEAALNDWVFFRDGRIEGKAPSLPVELIEV